jgi:hypothetical protein
MKLSEVSVEDGKKCAQLINLLKAGRWELSGPDIAAHSETVRWVHALAGSMAEQLKGSSSASTMKVKSVGSLPVASKKKSKR